MTTAIRQGPHRGGTVEAVISARFVHSIARLVAIVGSLLIVTVLILGFVVLSLGIGAEGRTGLGPDRPPPPMTTGPQDMPTGSPINRGLPKSAGGDV